MEEWDELPLTRYPNDEERAVRFVSIKTNSGQAVRATRQLLRQIPFALSGALNQVALDFRAEEREHIARTFNVVNKAFVLNRVQFRRKDFAKAHRLKATVRIDPERDFLAKHESIKGSRFLAVPARAARIGRRGQRGCRHPAFQAHEDDLRHPREGAPPGACRTQRRVHRVPRRGHHRVHQAKARRSTSPFKRGNSPYYYVAPKVPGFGRLPQRSTGTTREARARAMEVMLKELPRWATPTWCR